MRKFSVLSALLLCFALFLCGCVSQAGAAADAHIVSFEYSEAGYPYWYAVSIIRTDGGEYLFTSDCFAESSTNLSQKQGFVSAESMVGLQQVLRDNGILKWNGFDKSDDDVLDGGGFLLLVSYDDGSELYATGYMYWPDGFDEASTALFDYLEEMAKSIG